MTPSAVEPHVLFAVCAYEAFALADPTDTLPTITSRVDPLPWAGRLMVWAGICGFLAVHFRVVRR